MDGTIQVNDELKQIAGIIGEAATLVGTATKLYDKTFQSFSGNYLGKAQKDEEILATNLIKSLEILEYFYVQAQNYVDYCLENLNDLDKEKADSYTASMA